MSDRTEIASYVEEQRELLLSLARDIWDNPELGFAEKRAADLIAGTLGRAGFRVRKPVAGIDTAFVAEWGSGAPIVGLLGEYDALPGCPRRCPPQENRQSSTRPGTPADTTCSEWERWEPPSRCSASWRGTASGGHYATSDVLPKKR